MIQKLRRKFVAVVMGVAAFLLLAVFVILLVTTQTGMERQGMDMLGSALDSALRKDGFQQAVPDGLLPGEAENNGRKWNGRFNVFTRWWTAAGMSLSRPRYPFCRRSWTRGH